MASDNKCNGVDEMLSIGEFVVDHQHKKTRVACMKLDVPDGAAPWAPVPLSYFPKEFVQEDDVIMNTSLDDWPRLRRQRFIKRELPEGVAPRAPLPLGRFPLSASDQIVTDTDMTPGSASVQGMTSFGSVSGLDSEDFDDPVASVFVTASAELDTKPLRRSRPLQHKSLGSIASVESGCVGDDEDDY